MIATEADSACSREPIHVPGLIQSHGGFLALDATRGLTIVAASANIGTFVPGATSGDKIVGQSASKLLGPEFANLLRARIKSATLPETVPWQFVIMPPGSSQALDVAVHAYGGLIQVEVEPVGAQDGAKALTAVRQLQEIVARLQATGGTLTDLAYVATCGVRLLTGYERVLVYRFDRDWNGQAIAEDKVGKWPQSLGGLHFPASDIPAQARELYRRSPLRYVPDRDAVPVALDVDPAWTRGRTAAASVDLSFARLRSLSPIHLQYHRNMGVNGSMSLSIMHEGQLWGLMVCHHRRPHHPSPGQRAAAAALTDALALRIGPAERHDTAQARREDLARLTALLTHMADAEIVTDALTTGEVTINSLFASTGAALLYDGGIAALGSTPPEHAVRHLASWLQHQEAGNLYHNDNLVAAYPPWENYAAIASGVLAVFLSSDRTEMLLWFRPEEPQQVGWGGSPHKDAGDGTAILPRLSFERWVEKRHGFAKPWAEWELEMADTLRHGITDIMIRGLRRIASLNEQLRQSHKMEAVGQLTGGLAHDFNNLLAGISGSLELIQSRVAEGRTRDLDPYIGAAIASTDRAAALTHRLLAFSRRQTLDPKIIDVNRLVASMEDLIGRTVGPAIHLETVTSGGLWTTLCDANQLENALLNLAINARDAMPEGGRLTIEAANTRLDAAYAEYHDMTPGQYVALSVSDTGSGMAPEIASRAFDPFYTTKPAGEGTGLGLSMVYGFAKQSGGYARIYSEMGRGTTVRLYLPRGVDEILADVAAPGVHTPAESGDRRTVLLVDDEPVVRMFLGEVMRDLGYLVIEASAGAEALRVLRSDQPVDLLISDIGLPGGLDGRQLVEAGRIGRPKLKVLFVTGFAESAVTGDGRLAPDIPVLTKPFAIAALIAKIRSIM